MGPTRVGQSRSARSSAGAWTSVRPRTRFTMRVIWVRKKIGIATSVAMTTWMMRLPDPGSIYARSWGTDPPSAGVGVDGSRVDASPLDASRREACGGAHKNARRNRWSVASTADLHPRHCFRSKAPSSKANDSRRPAGGYALIHEFLANFAPGEDLVHRLSTTEGYPSSSGHVRHRRGPGARPRRSRSDSPPRSASASATGARWARRPARRASRPPR